MTIQLQIILFTFSVILFLFMLRVIRKSKLKTDLATAWILFGIGIIFISILPEIVYFFSSLIGVQTPINGLFLFMIFFLYCLVFYLYIKISILDEKLKNIIQYISIQFEDKNND